MMWIDDFGDQKQFPAELPHFYNTPASQTISSLSAMHNSAQFSLFNNPTQ